MWLSGMLGGIKWNRSSKEKQKMDISPQRGYE